MGSWSLSRPSSLHCRSLAGGSNRESSALDTVLRQLCPSVLWGLEGPVSGPGCKSLRDRRSRSWSGQSSPSTAMGTRTRARGHSQWCCCAGKTLLESLGPASTGHLQGHFRNATLLGKWWAGWDPCHRVMRGLSSEAHRELRPRLSPAQKGRAHKAEESGPVS